MPYDVSKTKDGYEVKLKSTGEVVARPKDMKGVKGYIYHATKGESEHMSFKEFLQEAKLQAMLVSVKAGSGGKWIGKLKNGKEITIPDDQAELFLAKQKKGFRLMR